MEYTNFTISNLSYVYEDIAASMLASPKAYIILITTSFVASRMNLLYGWEFSGKYSFHHYSRFSGITLQRSRHR